MQQRTKTGPPGLRGKVPQVVLQDLARERPLPASRALSGVICRSNAARDETATAPKECYPKVPSSAARIVLEPLNKARDPHSQVLRRLPLMLVFLAPTRQAYSYQAC